MENLFKVLYHRTIVGKLVIKGTLDLYHYFWNHFVSDEYFIKSRFKRNMGYELDLNNPKTLNEKINWLKLYCRDDLHTQCSDKYAVRSYIKEKIGEQYLVPLILMTKDVKDLNPGRLPDEPFIIKANHDSSGGIVVKDKTKVDWNELHEIFKDRLKRNYYYRSKEWQYKNIEPCIIVEKLLKGENGGFPLDYKVHCFNGKVNMIQVDIGRFSENHHRNWYNINWEREPYKWSSFKGKGKYTDPSPEDVERPRNLAKMLELSEVIAKDFSYVRVDWYDVEERLYFGEITFHHDGGTAFIHPKEWDLKLGEKLVLPALPGH